MSSAAPGHSAPDAPPAKRRLRPSQIALAVGGVLAVVTVASGILGAIEQWHDESGRTRRVFGGIPSPIQAAFYTLLPVLFLAGGWLFSQRVQNWERGAPDYQERKTAQGDLLIETASSLVPELHRHILLREDATPATFARYAGTTGGAIYGMRSAEPVGAATSLPGLFLCGASVMPGPGIEAVVRSGERAADCIQGAPRPW